MLQKHLIPEESNINSSEKTIPVTGANVIQNAQNIIYEEHTDIKDQISENDSSIYDYAFIEEESGFEEADLNKLADKRKAVDINMPERYSSKKLSNLLSKKDRIVTDLRKERNLYLYDQGSIEETQEEINEIDKVLAIYGREAYGGMNEDFADDVLENTAIYHYDLTELNKAVKSLRYKKARDVSQILINEHSRSKDSDKMKAVKAEVLRLSYHLDAIKNIKASKEEIEDLLTYYEVTIKYCEDYIFTKKHNTRYEKVKAVWENLSYEYSVLTLMDKEKLGNMTMGELLGMSQASIHDNNSLTKGREFKHNDAGEDTLKQSVRDSLKVFNNDVTIESLITGAGSEKKKKAAVKNIDELLSQLKEFSPGTVMSLDMKLNGQNIRILQDAENKLFVIDHHARIPLGRSATGIINLIERNIMNNPSVYGQDRFNQLMAEYGKEVVFKGEGSRFRGNLEEYLATKMNVQKELFTNTGRVKLAEYARDLENKNKTVKQIIDEINSDTTAERMINGVLLKESMDEEESDIEIAKHISMYDVQAEADSNDWTEEEKSVKKLMSEFILTNDTYIWDKNVNNPAQYVREVLLSNKEALKILLDEDKEADIITAIMNKAALNKVTDDKNDNFAGVIAETLRDLIDYLKDLRGDDSTDQVIEKLKNKNAANINDKLIDVNVKMEDSIKKSASIMQKNVNKIVDAMFLEVQKSEETDVLAQIMKDASKSEKGQGQFVKEVLKNYFANMNTLDQRSMLSSVLRSCGKANNPELSDKELLKEINERKLVKYKGLWEKKENDLSDKEKELLNEYREQKKSLTIGSNYFAGLIRGAGPLMHKMLQGIPEEDLPVEVRVALRDVKSKLQPIPERVVKNKMNTIRKQSGGKITGIKIEKNLGAASVGQTFKCRLFGPSYPENGKPVVIKLLRTDCQNRMKRESKVMLDCAKKVGIGMEETYKEQLNVYYDELDLSKEAKNIEQGQIYNNKDFPDVKAEKILNDFSATADTLVIEEAPGKTLDDILLDATKKCNEIWFSVGKKYIDENGQLQVYDNIKYSDENIEKTKKARGELVDLANDLIKKRDIMANISKVWVKEALFGSGYYHADLHAGNIMLSDTTGTLIDFGNAVVFTDAQKSSICKMMLAAGKGKADFFFEEFDKLLDKTNVKFAQFYTEEKKNEIKDAFEEILEMGEDTQAGERIGAALVRASELGVKLPSSIFNFSQGQLRLQKSIDDINNQIMKIQDKILAMEKRLIQATKFGLGINDALKTAMSKRTLKSYDDSIKAIKKSLGGDLDKDTFIKELLNKEYKKSNLAKGYAGVNARVDFDNKYLGNIKELKSKLLERKKGEDESHLPNFMGYRKVYQEYRDRWKNEFDKIKNDPNLSEKEKEKALSNAEKLQQAEGSGLVSKVTPGELGKPIYASLGLTTIASSAVNGLITLDDKKMEELFSFYEKQIHPMLELEEKIERLRSMQDQKNVSKETINMLAEEIFEIYSKMESAKYKKNPMSMSFNLELSKGSGKDTLMRDIEYMLAEKTKTTVEVNGQKNEIALGEYFKAKLNEYFDIAEKYAGDPKKTSFMDMTKIPDKDKNKIYALLDELNEIHANITKIQLDRYCEGRYDKEIDIKKYDFGDVMKEFGNENVTNFVAKVGVFNLFK